jgi:hypothetical protein
MPTQFPDAGQVGLAVFALVLFALLLSALSR